MTDEEKKEPGEVADLLLHLSESVLAVISNASAVLKTIKSELAESKNGWKDKSRGETVGQTVKSVKE